MSGTSTRGQERFSRLQALYEHAVALEPQARSAWLAKECGADVELLAEVEALVAADASTGTVFADLIGRAVHDALASGTGLEGRRIGPWRIVRSIGQGGMGVVYLAERADDQYRGQVAIKIGNTLFATPNAVERLRAERQILANLDHPNIARLLDGGTTAEGMPYLIMEYIEGVPIDLYCDQERLGLRERLELFRTVCAAVHYAHQHLVVHRDIKPSNILVTAEGRVKLLDFGIAKLLDDPLRGALERQHTIAEQRMLSPEYASPEHITGQPITTASDIYSLGVLLYRLLAGRQPYAFTGGTLIDLAQLVASAAPELPSAAAVRADGQGPTRELIAHARRTTPERLARALRGDLDNIVMTALRKEPDRRYRSAIQLGDDLRRHVEGLPVTARADTWSYRSGKFVRRHPFGVAVACAAVLFVAGYVATLWVQNERIRAEQARAEAAAEFLVGLFELFDPRQAQGRTVTVEDILRKGEERVDTELGAQPALQATLLDALGRVYYALGEYDEARPLLERALEGKGAQLGTKDPSYARTLDSLASTYVELERIEDAYDLRRQALAIESEALGAASVSTAENMAQLGRLLRESGRLDDAEAALKEAIAVLEQHDGTDESLSVAQNFLASVWTLRGDLAAAQDLYVQMLERDRARLGPDHPLMLKNLASLGVVMEQRGDYAGARCAYVEALAGMRRVLGDEHPEVGDTLAGLARVLTQLGDYEGAERQFSDALAIDRAKFGDGHFTIAYDESNLAAVVHAGGRLEESTTLYRDALDDYDHDDPRSLIYIAAARLGLADVLVDRGLLREAQQALADARSAWGRSPSPPAPWMLAVAQTTQGRAELAAGRYATAEALLTNGIEELAASRDAKDLRLRRALRAIVDLYERTDRASFAEPYRARLAASEAQVAQLALADCSPGASLR